MFKYFLILIGDRYEIHISSRSLKNLVSEFKTDVVGPFDTEELARGGMAMVN